MPAVSEEGNVASRDAIPKITKSVRTRPKTKSDSSSTTKASAEAKNNTKNKKRAKAEALSNGNGKPKVRMSGKAKKPEGKEKEKEKEKEKTKSSSESDSSESDSSNTDTDTDIKPKVKAKKPRRTMRQLNYERKVNREVKKRDIVVRGCQIIELISWHLIAEDKGFKQDQYRFDHEARKYNRELTQYLISDYFMNVKRIADQEGVKTPQDRHYILAAEITKDIRDGRKC